jgi:hypothetical protein
MGLADFAKQLQTGALGGDPAMRMADNTGNTLGFSSGRVAGVCLHLSCPASGQPTPGRNSPTVSAMDQKTGRKLLRTRAK